MLLNIICIAIGVIVLIIAVIELVKKDMLGARREQFTRRSIEEFIGIECTCFFALAAGLIISGLSYGNWILPNSISYAGWFLILGSVLAYTYLQRKRLVRK